MSGSPGLGALSRRANSFAADTVTVPRPRFRWGTRIVLPAAIMLAAAAVLAWSARDALWPAVDVYVVPVIAKARAAESSDGATGDTSASPAPSQQTMLVQAPGWIEPAPYAIVVPALTDGVVKEVFALEGQTVAAGEVLAKLIDDDAILAVRLSEAELAERTAATRRAEAEHNAAEARAAEVRDELERKRELAQDGTIAGATYARLALRLRAMEADVQAAAAEVSAIQAAERVQAVALDQARLALARTEIRSPVAGVVLSRSIEPGTRMMMAGPGLGEAREAGIARIYDPAHLQVRVDVPLADAAKVSIGTAATIVAETLPDNTFRGTVTRVVHEANIQRNTVQFKVSIENPDAALKPEMLVRVRLLSGSGAGEANISTDSIAEGRGDLVLLLSLNALLDRKDREASAWFVMQDPRRGAIATRRALTLGQAHDDGFIEILSGASPTDRAIVDPPAALAEGSRVRVLGEKTMDQGDQP